MTTDEEAKRNNEKSTAEKVGGCALLAVFALLLGFCAIGGEEEPQVPSEVAGQSLSGPNLNVQLRIASVWNEATAPTQIAMAIERVAIAVNAGAIETSPETRWLQANIEVPGVDRLGKEMPIDFGNMRFPLTDLKGANYENMSPGMILNLADSVELTSRVANESVAAYCSEPDNLEDARLFCVRAIAGIAG